MDYMNGSLLIIQTLKISKKTKLARNAKEKIYTIA